MKNITKIIDNLLKDIEQIELNYYKQALSTFFMAYKYESEFGAIPSTNIEYCQDGESLPKEVTTYTSICDKDITNYFFEIEEILNKELPITETLRLLKDIEFKSLNEHIYFSYSTIEIKNKLLNSVFELNKLLDNSISKLDRLKEIHYKKMINVEEFEILFSKSKNTQLNYRSRSRNPLPYLGGGKGKDLMYDKEMVEKWFLNHL